MHPSCCDALTELQGAFDSFAMGNYPYPSSYMGGALPAWPMRTACELLASPRLSSTKLLNVRMSSPAFLAHCVLSTKGHLERGLSPLLLANSSWHGGFTNGGRGKIASMIIGCLFRRWLMWRACCTMLRAMCPATM